MKHKNIKSNGKCSVVDLDKLCFVRKGMSVTKDKIKSGRIPVIAGGKAPAYYHSESNRDGNVITVSASGANAGFVNFFTQPIFASDCSTVEVIDPKKTDISYVYLNLQNQQNILYSYQQGGAQPHVYPADIVKLKIPIPSIEEQKEIVKTISTWDTAIDNIKKQITAHNKQRSGILQKLLEDNLKKYPMITLEQIFNIEVVPSKKDVLVEQGKYFVIDMGGVSSSGELIKKKMTDTTEHMLEVNDLIMPKDDIGHGNILGKVAIIDTANKYVLGDHVFRLCNKSQNNIQFLRILINSPKINRSIKRLGNGTSQIGLRKSDILKHLLPIPDIKEQNKISTEVLTWERKIYLLETILSKYELQRKGLIQKLLGNITKNAKH
ncbi:MAG: hypothetical protein HAW61_03990 [Candidatus Portiera sp.]|nr:hypothetical protein [Portiera sp.]